MGRIALTSVETLRLSDGRVLCARRQSSPAPGTVVILHGLLDSSEGWAALGEQVSGTRIAFDLPGFGAV
jgi:pimeloyl-ACP methyl ester carboxylesterase